MEAWKRIIILSLIALSIGFYWIYDFPNIDGFTSIIIIILELLSLSGIILIIAKESNNK